MPASPPASAGPDGARPAAPAAPAEQQQPLPAPGAVLSAQTRREALHLLLNAPVDTLAFCYVAACLWFGGLLALTVIGLPVLACCLLGCRRIGRFERARARTLLRLPVDEPSPLRPERTGFLAWVWAQLRDPVAWRNALYCFIRLPWGWFTFVLTCVSLLLWPLLPWCARGLTNVDRLLVRALLSPSDVLERRVAELESDRGVVVDTAAADLRRIERDLHDGAQARLVSLAMELGLAKEKLLEDPEEAARMVDSAHGEVKLALQELRDLARGIHPAILTDRGLGPAISALGGRCTVPVAVRVDLTERPVAAIEGIAYFTVSELLQNISKHAAGRRADVEIWRAGERLLIQVTDDGNGGAAATEGSGLAGLADRLDAVDGLLLINSPQGGPTVITAELPWR